MLPMPLARIAWRNVWRNWRHSLGSMLSIVVGFVAIALFQGYLADLEEIQAQWNEQKSMLGSVIIERSGASDSEGRQDPLEFLMTDERRAFVDAFLSRHASQVATRVRVLRVSGLASTGKTGVMFFAWGYDVEEGTRMRGPWAWNAVGGKPLQLAGPDSALLGGRLGHLLDCEGPPVTSALAPGGELIAAERPFTCRQSRVQLAAMTVSGQLNAVEPEVVGLFDAGLSDLDSRFVLIPLPLAQRLLDTNDLSWYSVSVAGDVADARRFASELNAEARAAGIDVMATPWRQHAYGELYRRGMDVLGAYRLLVIMVVVAIAGMSVFTTMFKAVSERVREVGALRSLGFRRSQIVRMFLLEGGFLAIVASLGGLAVSLLAILTLDAANISYSAGVASQPIPLTVSLLPGVVVTAILFLTAVALFASYLPARRAARLAIPDALGQT